ncbi:MAG: adenylate/guanylate cyclase domain-containing protein [Flavobacterium sp. JAD_PAG50586_2]|nr:MAG: adenylate/guanylate cyclase domain-containing protein [Flavobacterium sp. JAD_PAG50586_2]
MSLLEDISTTTNTFFNHEFTTAETTIVPTTDYSKLTFGNNGLTAELTFLFVDIRKSSELHETYGEIVAAKIYQSFHDLNVRIINRRSGQVRSFDGDRIMGVFSGDRKNNNAVEAALNIRYAVSEVLNKKLPKDKPINIGIGIDTGRVLITKVGRGRDDNNSDLVWVGKACNYASHMCNESENKIYISTAVFGRLEQKNRVSEGVDVWKKSLWF